MSHRALLYKIGVRRRGDPNDQRRLGEIEPGVNLLQVMSTAMNNFSVASVDGTKIVDCIQKREHATTDELFVILRHGESNVASDIVTPGGTRAYRRSLQDREMVRCGCLFRLPRASYEGWMAIHVNNNRGVKSLFTNELDLRFRNQMDDLLMIITPFVARAAITAAIEQGHVDRVRLIQYEKPSDRAFQQTNKWVRGDEIGHVELSIKPGRLQWLRSDLLRRHFGGDQTALNDIVTFEGMTFEEAKVEVVLENDVRRTFTLQKPDMGFPLAVDLDDDLTIGSDGDPSEASLLAALRSALTDTT